MLKIINKGGLMKMHKNENGFSAVELVIVLVVIALIGGLGWYFMQHRNSKASTKASTANTSSNQQASTPKKDNETKFYDNLASCTVDKLQFKHPLTGDMLYKYVKGMVDGKCDYYEEMPNNGRMDCRYTESERKVIAQYFKDSTSGKLGTESTDSANGNTVYKNSAGITYNFDGTKTANPAGTALDKNICTVSGY